VHILKMCAYRHISITKIFRHVKGAHDNAPGEYFSMSAPL
jgi:hypothetical protein